MARVFCLPAKCVTPGMVWPVAFLGTEAECHRYAIELSRTCPQEVSVEFPDRVVGYKKGTAELV